MCSNSGECFVVQKSFADSTASVIFGRNSYRSGASEVVYFAKNSNNLKQKCQHIEIDGQPSHCVILSKPASIWGADSGANDKNVTIGITWSENEPTEDALCSTDLVRLGLERASSAAEAIDILGSLVEQYSCDGNEGKFCFLICDPMEIWLLNVVGKLWAAELVADGYKRIPLGISITTKIIKSSANLNQKLQDLALWDGNGDLDFSKVFTGSPVSTKCNWPTDEQPTDSDVESSRFGLTNMFNVLRTSCTSDGFVPQTSQVSTLRSDGLSCHWFTATPNPSESVFKPFIFTDNVRISPLTQIPHGSDTTLLQRLHEQRNWSAVGNLLKSLETTCVEEVKRAICEDQVPNQEFDELLKDCVEAEVKFYR